MRIRTCSLALRRSALSRSFGSTCPTERQKRELEVQGFTILDAGQLCEESMLDRLASAAKRIVHQARLASPGTYELSGGFLLRDSPADMPWGVRGILAPAWGEPIFAEYLGSKEVQAHVSSFLDCTENDLMLPDADMLIFMNPVGTDRAQAWHRDVRWWGLTADGSADYTVEAQRCRWAQLQSGPFGMWKAGLPRLSGHNDYLEQEGGAYLRWELALAKQDTGLEIVPGSHRRFRTAFENDCLLPRGSGLQTVFDISPTAMSDGEHSGVSMMPGAEFVQLEYGQAVIWNGDCCIEGVHVQVLRD
eukprot:TRINITY_DN105619_c0_g1_i1.p1 TRINITY_DN105619_c0_g1~~TRINITY_DN105619_c0_g1_i1.p1  ORF type:complete len:304 (+),score=24.95 TRINITY_DN105619_c0_g1_i1:73-984(+)